MVERRGHRVGLATLGLFVAAAAGMTAAHADDQIDGPSTSWEAVVTASPFEWAPAKLCAALEPAPPSAAEQRRASLMSNELSVCRKAIDEHAGMSLHTPSSATRDLAARVEASLTACFNDIGARPYLYAVFDPSTECAKPYDVWAPNIQAMVDSDNSAAAADGRQSMARLRDAQTKCRTLGNSAVAAAKEARTVGAPSIPLGALIALSPSDRLPAEVKRIGTEIANCRAEAARRREDRLAALAARGVAALEHVEEKYLMPEEEEVLRQAIAALLALRAARLEDRKWVTPVLSAAMCIATDSKQAAAKEIKTEQTYARRYGGMVDKQKIYDLQQTIRAKDEEIAGIRALLKTHKSKPQPCGNKLVVRIYECFPREEGRPNDEVCTDRAVADYVDLAIPLLGAPWDASE